jgi:hypothetical protein
MRILLIISIVLIGHLSFGQTKTKLNKNKLFINKDLVTQIEITNNCLPLDSCQVHTYKLNDSMIEGLVDRLNKSDSIGICKYYNLYWINIYLTDGIIRTFRINGALIKENNDWCFDIKDTDYVENLWRELNNE